MNNQKETPGKSYLCYKNTEKYLCFLIICVNFAGDIKKRNSLQSNLLSLQNKKTKIMVNDNKNLNRIKVVLAEKDLQNKWLAEQIRRDQANH